MGCKLNGEMNDRRRFLIGSVVFGVVAMVLVDSLACGFEVIIVLEF